MLKVVISFSCYRSPQLDAKPPRSGPRTDYAAGEVIEDATEAEAANWLAAGLVEHTSSPRSDE